MAEQFDTKYFSGQGPVFIAERAASGQLMGLEFIGDMTTVTLTPSVDKETITENVSGLSAVGASFTKSVKYDLSMQMRSIKPGPLSIALQSSNTAKTAGTVTNEEHIAYKGKFIALKHTNVSNVQVSMAGAQNSVDYYAPPAANDYILHADIGMIEVLDAGTIANAEALAIDYSHAAQHHLAVAPENKEYYLVFSGMNRADNNKQTRCEMYKVQLSPSSLAMIESKSAEMPITGTVMWDALRPAGDQLFSWKLED